MTLPGHVFSAYEGVRGFDTTETVGPKTARAFRRGGYRFAVRYVRRDKPHASALKANEARTLLSTGIGLMIVQYVESESAWTPTGAKGARNGGVAASECELLGVPWGVTVWCDLEGIAPGTSSQRVIDYCNAWHAAVSGSGYTPGVYVGYRAGLTPSQLYRALRFTHYWGAYNLNSDQYPAVRGVQMKQGRARQADRPSGVTIDFQTDRVRADALGGRPTLLALEGWPELP
ncbi:MAG TPA: glycoside hydrolase domain-containing protein [Gemmatimonadaceae bacterium]|nr:glycoside hydrolase domain-containing protein [Gemmatimonadaceae bacterium]